MKNEYFKLQMIAAQALDEKYGFGPAPQQVTLLESDGEGIYILFRVGGHEYRCEDGHITNLEDQKQLDEELSTWAKLNRLQYKDLENLREAQKKQEEQFVTKELMLTEAYNAKRLEIEMLKGQINKWQELADDRLTEIERLEAKIGDWANTRIEALDKLSKAKKEAVRSIESERSTLKSKIAWYYTHLGEIEMLFFLGLITREENDRLHEEWKKYDPEPAKRAR